MVSKAQLSSNVLMAFIYFAVAVKRASQIQYKNPGCNRSVHPIVPTAAPNVISFIDLLRGFDPYTTFFLSSAHKSIYPLPPANNVSAAVNNTPSIRSRATADSGHVGCGATGSRYSLVVMASMSYSW